ncbi:MAG TPA: TetR/AcrR family transcriptional regulator [Hellea balneolensis]|uniref:TetR/AcrR family transcriptional regulator n=1 Tax=Hellea balneolensis TaxID=287478 RepID=A0A7C3CC29_9PROT|nr:TetR/AcrR family transcriptional regulator [Hellea balneolensis]
MRSKTEITKKKIIDAAFVLFTNHGRHNVSMKDISQKSGVSNGSIFHHFNSKDQIVIEVYVRERRSYWNTVFNAMEAWEGTPSDALGEATRASLHYQEKFPKRHKFMIECGADSRLAELTDPVQKLNAVFFARFYQWANPHFEAGTLAILQPELYSAIIFGPAQWVGRAWATDQANKKPSAYADSLAAIVASIFKPS